MKVAGKCEIIDRAEPITTGNEHCYVAKLTRTTFVLSLSFGAGVDLDTILSQTEIRQLWVARSRLVMEFFTSRDATSHLHH